MRKALWMLVLACLAAAALAAGPKPARPVTTLVDINRATVQELAGLPGMSAVWAARIVRFRPYRTKLDLRDQGVVPARVYERIEDRIVAHRDPPPGRP